MALLSWWLGTHTTSTLASGRCCGGGVSMVLCLSAWVTFAFCHFCHLIQVHYCEIALPTYQIHQDFSAKFSTLHSPSMKFVHFFLWLLFLVTVLGSEYSKNEHIFELTTKNFENVVYNTNYTTVVKFYAPWCGYCKQLAPIYHKLGKYFHKDTQLSVNVAAVNCDKLSNKELCSRFRIQSFPTIMVFRPPKYSREKPPTKPQRHASEVYSGERSVKAISSFVTSRIKNYVPRFHSADSPSLHKWFNEYPELSHVLLISKSHSVSPLMKSLAVDFLSSIQFGMLTAQSVPESLSVEGDEIELTGDVPLLAYFDRENHKFVYYDRSEKLNNKMKLSQWIIDVTGSVPLDGPLSKKEVKKSKYRSGKKTTHEMDEL